MSFDRDEMLDKLKRAPDRLERLVEDHPDDLLSQPGAGGDWGAVEIMAFLRDWDAVVDDRLSLMLEESEPEFEDEDPDLWSIERDYHTEAPANVQAEFRSGREQLVHRLSSLGDDAWQRTARMPEGNVITVEGLVAALVANDQLHMARLRELLL
jgi:hypothetical protein